MLEGLRPATRTALADFSALVGRLREQATGAGVDELLRSLVDGIRYGDYLRAEGPESADRLENVRELIASAAETVIDEGGEVGLTPLEHFLQRASLVAGVDQLDPSADAIVMMTVHNAKGLEFPVVFIAGLEDGLFPLARAFDEPEMLEEERRLFYVGITRAERTLYLSHAELRRRNGELLPAKPSIFLGAIPTGLVEQRETMKVRSSGRLAYSDRRPLVPVGAVRFVTAFSAPPGDSGDARSPLERGDRCGRRVARRAELRRSESACAIERLGPAPSPSSVAPVGTRRPR